MSKNYDPLAAFRKAAPALASEAPPVEEPSGYVAFGTKDRVKRLRIRSRHEPVNAPGYNILLNVVYDEDATHFILVYSILSVLVRGENLHKVIFAIENAMADFIQEFDPGRWPKPCTAGEPLIASIELRASDSGQAEDNNSLGD